MTLKDFEQKLPGGETVDATITHRQEAVQRFFGAGLGSDEIGIFPLHGAALAQALGDGVTVSFQVAEGERRHDVSGSQPASCRG